MNKPIYKSIKHKIILWLLILVFSIVIPVEFFDYHQQKQKINAELKSLVEQKIYRLQDNLQLPLWELDTVWVEKVIAAEMLDEQVYAIQIESDNQLFAGKVRNEQWQLVNITKPITGAYLTENREIQRKDETIGVIKLYITHKFLDEQLSSLLLLKILKILILNLFLVGVLHRLLNKLVIDPIQSMLEVINEIANGNYKHNIKRVEENDEIGLLAIAMQRMSDNLKHASEAATAVAEGDYSHRITVRGPDDLFALAMNKMTISLSEVVKQIDIISLGDYQTHLTPRSENDTLGIATERMTLALESFHSLNQEQIWLEKSIVELTEVLRNAKTIDELSEALIKLLCRIMDAKIGGLFLVEQDYQRSILSLASSFAYPLTEDDNSPIQFQIGEGLVGQVAKEQKRIILENNEQTSIKIQTGLLSFSPQNIIITPFSFKHEIKGVIELGFNKSLSDIYLLFIDRTQDAIANAFESLYNKINLSKALQQSQVFSEELQISNEELVVKTEALESQAIELQASERISLNRAKELEESNRYKSEFLANMSHELRTPLNSLLILAKLFIDNEQGNLTDDQVESAEVIQSSGQHLLKLINEILDLSKVEAGQMLIKLSQVHIASLTQLLQKRFEPMTQEKQLAFHLITTENLADYFISDQQKIDQILTNLIANAIKFTNQGSVTLSIDTFIGDNKTDKWIKFEIIDTGIGIADEQLQIIFSAFHQVDSGYNRRYGGTGLGLSIVLAYTQLLGGKIEVTSKLNEGTCFSLYLPANRKIELSQQHVINKKQNINPVIQTHALTDSIVDDRESIVENDKVMLVLEDDIEFAKILYQQIKTLGYQCLVSHDAQVALVLLEHYSIQGIVLDLCLPSMGGKEFLKTIKATEKLRHIPVHIISVLEDQGELWEDGIVGYLSKPVTQQQIHQALQVLKQNEAGHPKNLLIIEADIEQQHLLLDLLKNENIEINLASTTEQALNQLDQQAFDCIILDIEFFDHKKQNFLNQLAENQIKQIPLLIVYADRTLNDAEKIELQQCTNSLIIHSKQSPEQLKDEVTLFLHKIEQTKPNLDIPIDSEFDNYLTEKTLMIVDDDMRNGYALARALRGTGLEVIIASSGQDALDLLDSETAIDIVLMDIMMPEMDGFETIKKIRLQPTFATLPIIAITAKALPEDKAQCLQAGANDYLLKPIDLTLLMTTIKTWLKT